MIRIIFSKVGFAFFSFVFIFLSSTQCALAAGTQPHVLTLKEATKFRNIFVKLEVKRENTLILKRLLAEKQSLFKTIAASLAKDHLVKQDAVYKFVVSDNTLYRLSTNKVAKGKEPKREVIKKFKTGKDSLPLRRLMVSRLQCEKQISVLTTLIEENRQETQGWDALLRKTFDLKPTVQYQIKKRDDGTFEIIELPQAKSGK